MKLTPEVKREPWWPLAWNIHGDDMNAIRSARIMMSDGSVIAITHQMPITPHDPPYRVWRKAKDSLTSVPVGIGYDEIDVRCTLLEEAYPGSMPYGGVA